MVFNDSTRDKDDTTVRVGHSRRYCNTGYDQSQGRRPSTFKCIGPISKGDTEPQLSRQKLIRIRTADRQVLVDPGSTAIPGRPVSGGDHNRFHPSHLISSVKSMTQGERRTHRFEYLGVYILARFCTGERAFQCGDCVKVFRRKEDLKRHEDNVHKSDYIFI